MSHESQTPPETLPIFPLTGSLLLPGNFLPLNIFEPRYRDMVADALDGTQYIGMIQPVVPRQDNQPEPDVAPDNPDVYAIGCAGRIEQAEKQPDGRYLILLKGVSRFRVGHELPRDHEYREVIARYDEFTQDLGEPQSELSPGPLLAALEDFGEKKELEFDLDRLKLLPGILLLNGLSAALPFSPAEKQALLEAPTPGERQELLLELMGWGFDQYDGDDYYAPPIVN